MTARSALAPLAGALAFVGAAPGPATQAPAPRNDYARLAFTQPLASGMQHFYARDFASAQADFARALVATPDNTLAITFLNAAAAQRPGQLDALANDEEDATGAAPKSYVAHVRLGFTYVFESSAGKDRLQDAREEFTTALALAAAAPAAHVGLGIMRFDDRSPNRAKIEFQAALKDDPSNVLALEYLGELYQTDLRDPERGLQYVIDVPNLVPGYADIDFHIGSLMFDLGQLDAAATYLRRGIELDTGHVGEAGQHGYTLLARVYVSQRKFDAATAALDSAINADVDTIYAQTLLVKIRNGDFASPGPTPAS